MQVNKLKGKIVEAGFSQRTLACKLNMSVNSLNSKVNGKTPFNTVEVVALCDALGISENTERADIFLT